ncbi:hypothetical protein UNDYM_4263 [Undibacterium sp. YM2]|uniref:hypothetical protein n=1 Tax=Undibacterium sp. YM2 TaxID=2058625 RepID=UPI001331E40B|nr:hypothetical protein [Undibacterium sp. YM2]BBB68516.1 hypothetical protein UNDYM_4263 [Undibacterium sp. YM2]
MNATLLQQLHQNLRLVAQGMAQAGAALLDAASLPSHLATDLQSQPALPTLPSPLFALPLHHLGACVQLNIRGETPQASLTS